MKTEVFSKALAERESVFIDLTAALLHAAQLVEREVVINFEAIAKQNEIGIEQRQRDVQLVRLLLLDSPNAVSPELKKISSAILNAQSLTEAIAFDRPVTFCKPAKPLPEGSLLRDTIRRLHYVQAMVDAVAKWISEMNQHDDLKHSGLYAKLRRDLVKSFKSIVIQVQQAAVIIGKYRDMGDIIVIRDLTVSGQSLLVDLKDISAQSAKLSDIFPSIERIGSFSSTFFRYAGKAKPILLGTLIVALLFVAIVWLNRYSVEFVNTGKSASASLPNLNEPLKKDSDTKSASSENIILSPVTSAPLETSGFDSRLPKLLKEPSPQVATETQTLSTESNSKFQAQPPNVKGDTPAAEPQIRKKVVIED